MLGAQDRLKLQTIAQRMTGCRRLLFITGAGISAESGLPTYRGISGLYENKQTEEGYPIEDALSGQMLQFRPEITWRYIAQIEAACRDKKHNRGHQIIAALEKRFEYVLVLTQNIDGFHHEADSSQVIDIHGDIHDLICVGCKKRQWVKDYSGLTIPPYCPDCGGLQRPDVVLFGEMVPMDKYQRLITEMDEGFDMVFSIGTTSVFPYIAQPVIYARRFGLPTVEINPGLTAVTDEVEYKIAAGAVEALDCLVEQLDGIKPGA